MALDKRSKQIIDLLSENARISYSTLAKKIGISRELATYKVNQLVEKGAIRQFVTLIDAQKLGYFKSTIYVRLQSVKKNSFSDTLSKLKTVKNVNWISTLTGSYDLAIGLTSESLIDLDEQLKQVIVILGKQLNNYVLLHKIKEHALPLRLGPEPITWSLNQLNGKIKIDDTDMRILDLLKKNARWNLVDISKNINTAPITAKKRIKALESSGIISQYVTEFGYDKLGLNWTIFLIRLIKTPEIENKFMQFISTHPRIDYCVSFIGNWNYQITILSKDNEDLHRTFSELRDFLGESLQDYTTVTVCEQHLWRP